MHGLARLQLVGPVALLGTVAGAEVIAYVLTLAPTSELLWYLHLEVFGVFRRGRAELSGISALPFAQFFLIAAPLGLLAAVGYAFRRNLIVALSSNLSFVYAAFLLY